MEVVRGRRSRDMTSPPPPPLPLPPHHSSHSHGRMTRQTFKRVQVVYYLSRNGQLEHPHFMEVTHLANQNLRLKDVIDRLTVLRGKGMPSMYSWSCKRCYKNGYVWNDLSENDVIYPSEGGAEYILKGSEVIEGCTTAEKFPQFQEQQQRMQRTKIQPKLKSQSSPRVTIPEVVGNNNRFVDGGGVEDDKEEEEEYYEEKVSYTVTPRSRCSRGISTDEVEKPKQQQQQTKSPVSELTLDGSPPPPSTTSSNLSDKSNTNNNNNTTSSTTNSKRYEDGEMPLVVSRNSMLLQLIACGSSLPFKSKSNGNSNNDDKNNKNNNVALANKQRRQLVLSSRKSNCSDLHRGVLCKNAAVKIEEEEEEVVVVVEEEEEVMIKCMSENPRFGNLQAEEKEYFSGSIVEAINTEERAHIITPSLKKSSSYNEERSSKAIIMAEEEQERGGEEEEEEEMEEEEEDEEYYKRREKCMNGKCIPRKRSSTKQSKK